MRKDLERRRAGAGRTGLAVWVAAILLGVVVDYLLIVGPLTGWWGWR